MPRRTTSGKIISALHLLPARPRNYGCVASILTVPGEIAPESEVELRILYSSLWPGGSWKLSNAAWKFSLGHAGKAAAENGMRPGKTSNWSGRSQYVVAEIWLSQRKLRVRLTQYHLGGT